MRLTEIGTILGTAAYMSPEQVRGEHADARSDLWSFGVVLYELASASLPFDGTRAEIFEAVLSRPPVPILERSPELPRPLAQVIDRLLAKNLSARYQTAADVRADLRAIARSGSTATPGRSRRQLAYRSAGAALALGALGGAGMYFWSPGPSIAPVIEWQQLTDFPDSATEPALSSDGRMLAFLRGGRGFPRRDGAQLYVKLLPDGEPLQLTDTPNPKCCPAFTPDGLRIAFTSVSRGSNAWDTFTVPVLGGAPTQLLGNAAGLAWIDEHDVLFSEIKGTGMHMGAVTASDTRTGLREIYFPDHEREMVHYTHLSPDRRWVLMVEMGRAGGFGQRCRVVGFAGNSAMREVGPAGGCASAAWSLDGRWMYLGVETDGQRHLWRQRFPDGEPEQVTFGPTEEEGMVFAADGRSLVTSVGSRRTVLWLRDGSGERPLSQEGAVSAARLSADGRRVYYLLRRTAVSPDFELRMSDLESGESQRFLPGLSILDFDVSYDEREIAFTTAGENDNPRIWLASLDLRSPPRELARGADQVMFGSGAQLVFRSLGQTNNVLFRINKDGTAREKVSDLPIMGFFDVSPDGTWATVVATEAAAGYAIPIAGGAPLRLCETVNCQATWSGRGEFLYLRYPAAEIGRAGPGRNSIVFPLRSGQTLPELPAGGLTAENVNPAITALGARVLDEDVVAAGPDPSVVVFTRLTAQSNLFRIPLD